MTQYRLVAVAFREVTSRDAAGNVTAERRYRQGDIIDLTGSEEQRLLLAGALAPLTHQDAAETLTDPADGTAEDGSTADGEKPKRTANVAAWRDYAIAQGVDATEVDQLSKAELIELVG